MGGLNKDKTLTLRWSPPPSPGFVTTDKVILQVTTKGRVYLGSPLPPEEMAKLGSGPLTIGGRAAENAELEILLRSVLVLSNALAQSNERIAELERQIVQLRSRLIV